MTQRHKPADKPQRRSANPTKNQNCGGPCNVGWPSGKNSWWNTSRTLRGTHHVRPHDQDGFCKVNENLTVRYEEHTHVILKQPPVGREVTFQQNVSSTTATETSLSVKIGTVSARPLSQVWRLPLWELPAGR